MARRSLADRFWDKVLGEPNSGCWLWTGCVNNRGYGSIGAGGENAPMLSAHRLSWEMHYGEIPEGLNVCHKCDTPSCVNPKHLFLGTPTDNNRDTVAKGRHRFGTGGAKLTEEQVLEIRNLGHLTHEVVASRYGVGPNAIYKIRTGRKWAWL